MEDRAASGAVDNEAAGAAPELVAIRSGKQAVHSSRAALWVPLSVGRLAAYEIVCSSFVIALGMVLTKTTVSGTLSIALNRPKGCSGE